MSNKTFINIEPTWESLCNLAQGGVLPPKELMQACKLADMVRQSQKNGDRYIKFNFTDGEIYVTYQESEEENHQENG